MSRKGLVVSVNSIELSACEGYGVLRFVKGMEMCWFWCNMSLSSYGEIQDSSVSQSARTEVSRFRFRVHVTVNRG